MKALHITPHFGGGVGRALLAAATHVNDDVEHEFICLEIPKKDHVIRSIRKLGCEVRIAPSTAEIIKRVEACDVLQLEWWCHPATISCLSRLSAVPMRLVVWCHVSGLHGQIIPEHLILSSTRFLLTSGCSYGAESIKRLGVAERERLSIVPSTGGFGLWPRSSACRREAPLSTGYIGSLNFAKLHPDYVQFLASVTIDNFRIRMIGDTVNQSILQQQADTLNLHGVLNFVGYVEDVAIELSKINVLAYLLNPTHYGTNENALLESMAMGIVPVVLNNPAECEIVQQGLTGMVVDGFESFSEAMQWLYRQPQEREKLGNQAAESVQHRFTSGKLADAFLQHYRIAMQQEKRTVNFRDCFGRHPSDWFRSCQADKTIFSEDGHVRVPANRFLMHALTEGAKGSAIQFHRYFPDDPKLAQWAKQLSLWN